MSCELSCSGLRRKLMNSRQRLEDEYDSNVIVTAPTVPYKGMFAVAVRYRANDSALQRW